MVVKKSIDLCRFWVLTLLTSMTAVTSRIALASPFPVTRSTPADLARTTGSTPAAVSAETTCRPTVVPPATATRRLVSDSVMSPLSGAHRRLAQGVRSSGTLRSAADRSGVRQHLLGLSGCRLSARGLRTLEGCAPS